MNLPGKKIAILVEHHYQDLEVWYPLLRLREAGAKVVTLGTGSAPEYVGKYGYPVKVDKTADKVKASNFDGLVIPGGWAPDRLRMSEPVLDLVREMNRAKKPIACICHGGWVLVSAGVLRGKKVTSFAAIRDDMVNAGAKWVDEEVVVDKNLVTSRKPDDLPAFMQKFIELLATEK
ncbi:MAG: type 1 glutamine amidotransferase [Calditrichaeota bacterium]|nr:type 1 glutamine amidotransferase [Calditrichota bacterium]MCB9367761.1 type 1 glutamine amidotransferase [Calditrichota bacterium]